LIRRSASGEILLERRCRTERLGAFLSERSPGRVIVETCTEAFRVAAAAQRAGHEVRVVAATLVRSLGVGQRGLKNDVRDARVLSEAPCRMELPSVHIPTVIAQEVMAICVSREALIKTRTQLVGRVRGYVRARPGRVLRATPESLPKRVRTALLEDSDGLPAHLERVLLALETISTQIADADAELRVLAEADARMRRLMTVPGVGPVTAARFVAAIDRIERFPNAASVASYLGLVPGENTTGFRTKRTPDSSRCAPGALGPGAGGLVALQPS
jgi:transposase